MERITRKVSEPRTSKFPNSGATNIQQDSTTMKGLTQHVYQGGQLAVELIRPMGNSSRTFLVRADDNQLYVAKMPALPRLGRTLVNELLATRLALLLGLPARPAEVISFPCELIPQEGDSQISPNKPGPPPYVAGFGSSYPGAPSQNLVVDFLPRALLNTVSNFNEAFWGFLVFDLWTGKRTGRQAIFSRPAEPRKLPYSAWFINHSTCFGGSGWEFADDEPLALYAVRSVYSSVVNLNSFEPYLSRIESLQIDEILHCTEAIPAEWIGTDQEILHALTHSLHERCASVRHTLAKAIESDKIDFPMWT